MTTDDHAALLELENVSTEDAVNEVSVKSVSKFFGHVIALKDVSMELHSHQVIGVLGDNGLGKSTLIRILSGVHQPDEGTIYVGGKAVTFRWPRDPLNAGIATVHQDLGMIPLMSIWRNFFLSSEPTRGWEPFRRVDVNKASRIAREEMRKMGIDVRETTQTVGTLSGGERQSVAISRAIYFGARVLILDEPMSALGVKQSGARCASSWRRATGDWAWSSSRTIRTTGIRSAISS